MRKFFLLLGILFVQAAFSQQPATKLFCLTDQSPAIGSKLTAYTIRFALNGDSLLPICYPFLDSTAVFLQIHPEIILEISDYTDIRQKNMYCSNLSQKRAFSVVNYLHKKGIPNAQMIAKAYGNTRPLRLEDGTVLTEAYILSKPSKDEQEKLFAMNRRVEFKIIGIVPANRRTFTLADSVFYPGSVFRTYSVWYDLDAMRLRPESKLFLDSVVHFLNLHKEIIFEVGVYTDSRGNDDYNNHLSDLRAKDICNYLISQGISSDRLFSKGYGQSFPIVPDDVIKRQMEPEKQEALYQQNRRVEFKIIKM